MTDIAQPFSDLFADPLNRLSLAYRVLEAGLENCYNGNVDFDLTHSQSAFTTARLIVQAHSVLQWGNGWSEWSATGEIRWLTTSGHYVRFEFSKEQHADIILDRVVIGDDKSEWFYPEIADVCKRNNIPLTVEVPTVEESK